MITNKGDIIMKYLLILCAMLMLSLSCSSVTEPQDKPPLTEIYTLPYYRHYAPNAQFLSDNPIDTSGVIKQVIFSVSNFNDTVEFNFLITVDYYDTLYYSPKLCTEAIEKGTFILDAEFDGLINVHIRRYETFKPIDFECEISYYVKD